MAKKEVSSYIVLKRGGMQKGQVVRTDKRLRVGAKTEKEAIELCKQKDDPTGGYRVYYKEVGRRLPRGVVMNTLSGFSTEPYVEIEGELYIRTEEYKSELTVEDENTVGASYKKHVYQKYVKRYARKASDVKWVLCNTYTMPEEGKICKDRYRV